MLGPIFIDVVFWPLGCFFQMIYVIMGSPFSNYSSQNFLVVSFCHYPKGQSASSTTPSPRKRATFPHQNSPRSNQIRQKVLETFSNVLKLGEFYLSVFVAVVPRNSDMGTYEKSWSSCSTAARWHSSRGKVSRLRCASETSRVAAVVALAAVTVRSTDCTANIG